MKPHDKRKFMIIYYINKYKEYPIASRDSFRNYFIHKHGKYEDLEIVIKMIEIYQMKFYGQTIQGYMDHTKEKRKGGR